MSSAINSALSGFAAATQRINTAAKNIANLNTGKAPASGQTVQNTAQSADTIDPAKQLVNAKVASDSAQGDLSVLKVQQNLSKSLFDIIS